MALAAAYDHRPPELDTVSAHWQLAIDATDRALEAAAKTLTATEIGHERSALAEERREAAQELADLARMTGVRPVPWLSPVPVSKAMLGLPTTVTTCLFDLDGVLTDSGVLHASAWAGVLDDFLLETSARTERQFIPFDRDTEYREFLDGRPRLEGLHAFLESRGIRIPEGRAGDAADAATAHGLARRKDEMLKRALHERGSTALRGARRYLEASAHTGLRRAVVSASVNTSALLELAGLATLVEVRIDADAIKREGLRSRPAPDMPLAACRRLGACPEEAVTFTHTAAGVAAGHEAGLMVVGIARGEQAERLQHFGSERVVPSLAGLLDPRLLFDISPSGNGGGPH